MKIFFLFIYIFFSIEDKEKLIKVQELSVFVTNKLIN